jgi:hypothetical protein
VTTLSLAIPHVTGRPERDASLDRLLTALGPFAPMLIHHNRSPAREWSEAIWDWSVGVAASHSLFLQDDLIPCPQFWPALHSLIERIPDQIIGLHACSKRGPAMARESARLYTTSDGLAGPQYVMPTPILKKFLAWRDTDLRPGWDITEDTLIGCFCLATGRRVYHPIPAIARLDLTLQSTWGNKQQNDPSVLWTDGEWDLTDWRSMVPHLGRYYATKFILELCRRWVIGWTPELDAKATDDVWRGEVNP